MIQLAKKLTIKERMMILLSIGLVAFGVWIDLEIPSYTSEMTTLLQQGTTIENIMKPGWMMIGLALLSFATAATVGFLGARVAASFTTRLRFEIYHQVMGYSQAEIKQFSIPSLLTRTTNDLTQLQALITMGLQVVTKGPMMAGWAMTKIAGKNGAWTWAVAGAVIVLLSMLSVLLFFAFPKQRVVQKLTDKLNAITREMLMGIRVVRAYNAENYQQAKFSEANDELTQLNLFVSRLMGLMNPVMTLIASGLTLSVYWIGTGLINNASLENKLPLFSDMIVFSSYGMQVVIGFMLMTIVFMILPRALVSAKRINEVLALSSSVSYPEQTIKQRAETEQEHICFEDVSFRYSPEAEAVIEHISFTVKKGQTVAFIGSTGSGKSTLIHLLPRFYDVSHGVIRVDGVDVKEYAQEELHNKIAIIPQKALLFSGTIRSNIAMGTSKGSPVSDEDIWNALELAQAKSFVERKEKGLDEEVAQGGTNFSGGQRQRLAIARALARKPEILIFDDSFSALDYKTDRMLRLALKKETADMTKLIVAQRISTIMDADHIVVLDQGRAVGQGTHKELLASNSVYQEIAYSQLSKEELENEK